MNQLVRSYGRHQIVRPARRRRRRRRPQPQQHDHNEARNNETKSAFTSSLTTVATVVAGGARSGFHFDLWLCVSVQQVSPFVAFSHFAHHWSAVPPIRPTVPFAIDPLRSDQLTFSGPSCVFEPAIQICHFSHRKDTIQLHALSLRSCWIPLPSRESTPSATTKRASKRKWGTKFFHDCKE